MTPIIVRREKARDTEIFAARMRIIRLSPIDIETEYEVVYVPSEGEPIVLEAFRPNIPDAFECMKFYAKMSELRWQRHWFEQKRAAENEDFPEHHRCLARTRKLAYERLISDRYGWEKKPS